ncbi:MAG TPA: universal stress protein [Chitinophagaceae bacterium]|nr:universal stress protein [Chitinophagaceae bacterium]
MKNNIKNILVPVDFSDTSLNALKTAISIAKQQRAKIILLNVVDTTFMFGFKGVYYISEKTIDSLVDVSARMLSPLLGNLKEEHMLECTSEIKVGIVPQAIVNSAYKNNADLIIMGTHGASGVREFFIGSTAQKVVKIASCPVLTIPPNKKWVDFKTILFPIRPVAGGVEKYDFLRKLIRHNYPSIKILILAPTYNDLEKETLQELVKKLKTKLKDDGIKISGSLISGTNMTEAVLKTSKSIGADMIVITVTTDPAFKQFFIGPFEQHVVNHSTVPVLSIRPKLASPDSQVVIQQIHESFPGRLPSFA